MKKFLPVALFLSIIIFIIFSFLLPRVSQVAMEKRNKVRELVADEKLLPALATSLSSKSQQVDLLNKSFPEKKDFVLVAGTLDTLGLQEQVLVDLHFESEEIVKDENGDYIVSVRITIEGTSAHITGFLKRLAHGRYLYKLQTVEGDAPEGIQNKNKVVIKAKLYAWVE